MRKVFVFLALALPLAASAQTGVVAVHPENPQGRIMTMEEAVMGIGTRPQAVQAMWVDENTYLCLEGREVKAYDVRTGEAVEYKPAARPQQRGMRGGVTNKDGITAFTKGRDLFISDGTAETCIAQGENDQISYGQSVSRNEFGINGGIFWSPEGSKLAFYRKDESRGTDFPLLDISTRTGTLKNTLEFRIIQVVPFAELEVIVIHVERKAQLE